MIEVIASISDAYTRDTRIMLKQIEESGETDLITGIEQYLEVIKNSSWSATTRVRRVKMVISRLNILMEFISRATEMNDSDRTELNTRIVKVSISARPILDALYIEKDQPQPKPDFSLSKILELADQQKPIPRAVIYLLTLTGKPARQLVDLTWEDVRFSDDRAVVTIPESGEEYTLPAEVLLALKDVKGNDGVRLFPAKMTHVPQMILMVSRRSGVKITPTILNSLQG
jgi:integrase